LFLQSKSEVKTNKQTNKKLLLRLLSSGEHNILKNDGNQTVSVPIDCYSMNKNVIKLIYQNIPQKNII